MRDGSQDPGRNDGAADRAEPATAVEEADIALSERVADARHNPAVRALGTLAEIGDQPPLLALCAGTLAAGLVTRRKRVAVAGARMLLSFTIATVIKATVKRSVSRTRPKVLLDEGVYDVQPLGPDKGDWHSFPSGHTAGSLAVARALARTIPEAALPAYAAAAAIAAVQVPTARHFASDVAAGAMIGLAADALAARVGREVERLAVRAGSAGI